MSSSVTDTTNLALKDMSNVTTIDGGKITTGTISAARLNVKDIFANNINMVGETTSKITSANGSMVIDFIAGSIYIA